MTDAQLRIHQLSQSLEAALIKAYVEGKRPPFRVPARIDGDLFLPEIEVSSRAKAISAIQLAVARAAALE